MSPHCGPNHRAVRRTSRQRHDVTYPVQVIRVEIAADQQGPTTLRGIINYGPKLLEPLSRVHARVQVDIPDAQITPRCVHNGRNREAAAVSESKIATLQGFDFNTADGMPADEAKSLIVNTRSARRECGEVPQLSGGFICNARPTLRMDNLLEQKEVGIVQPGCALDSPDDFLRIGFLREIQ